VKDPVVERGALQLNSEHRKHLLESGISSDVIDARKYWSADKRQHGEFLKALQLGSFVNKLPGLMIPIYGPSGEQESAQLRLDIAPVSARYASPARSERPVTMDVHPFNAPKLGDASIELWITEGVKKADAATSKGLCCIALMGVTMWTKRDEKGNVTALPEWESIELHERNVYIAFDSDVSTKTMVAKALGKLKTFLKNRGAFVHTVYLPNAEDGSKVGLDDYLASGKTVKELYALPQYLPGGQYSNPKLLAEMNKQLAVLDDPPKSLLFEKDGNYTLVRPGEIRHRFLNLYVEGGGDALTWWLKQTGRRELKGIAFRPGQEVTDYYNIWKGWGVEPKQGDITPFWDFVREVICAGDDERFTYIRNWMAHAVQKPAEMPRVALLFKSVEGTGKGMFVDWFKPIFGQHTFTATSLDNVLGNFNSHLGDKLFVFANEAVWGGYKANQGRMKALITDSTTDITAKGKDTVTVDNYKRWIFASNEDFPVAISRSDRRFVVFEVSDVRKGDAAYYKRLEDLRDRGPGPAALMYELLQIDISTFNPASIPKTGRAEIKELSSSPFDQWLKGSLMEAEFRRESRGHECYEPWTTEWVSKNTIFDSYKAAHKGKRGEPLAVASFWDKMREVKVVIPDLQEVKRKDRTGRYTRATMLQVLDKAREAFAAYMGEGPSLWEQAVEEAPGPCEECEKIKAREAQQTPF
jgi:hypothetical protein